MSDRVKPAEIEDVLSSIRRLVVGGASRGRGAADPRVAAPSPNGSEEVGTAANRAPDAADPETRDQEPALVLGPSLRVQSPPEGTAVLGPDDAVSSGIFAEWERDTRTETDSEADEPESALPSAQHALADDDDGGALAGSDDAHEGEAPHDPEGVAGNRGASSEAAASAATFEHRLSPFLSESFISRQARLKGAPAEERAAPRSGFGFGAARGDDPVRHVPLGDPSRAAPRESSLEDTRSFTLGLSSKPDADEPKDGDRVPEAPAPPAAFSFLGAGRAGANVSGAPTTTLGSFAPAADPVDPDAEAQGRTPDVAGALADATSGTDAPRAAGAAEAAAHEEDDPFEGIGPAEAEEDAAAFVAPKAGAGESIADDPHPTTAPDGEDPGDAMDFLSDDDRPERSEQASVESEDLPPPSRNAIGRDSGLNVFGDGSPSLDEEELRAMIADVVHRELQGALGERVSNNIRRLVRREIARALESRDLD